MDNKELNSKYDRDKDVTTFFKENDIPRNGIVYQEGKNNSGYFGHIKENRPNGLGYEFDSDHTYKGEFFFGQYSGIGINKNSKEEYIGCYKNGLKSGQGQIKSLETGWITRGEFINGKLEGFGLLQSKKDDYYYEGEFKRDKFNGYGYEKNKSVVFCGNFVGGKKNGFGLLETDNGSFFYGEFEKDKKTKFGIETHNNQDSYIGEYQKGKSDGIGKYTYAQAQSVYYGDFESGQCSGFGKMETNESFYMGGWILGLRNGIGYQETSRGENYFGFWKDGLRHGLGREVKSDVTYNGEWYEDQKHGLGVIQTRSSKDKYCIYENGNLVELINNISPAFLRELERLNYKKFEKVANKRLKETNDMIEKGSAITQKKISRLKTDFKQETNQLNAKIEDLKRRCNNIDSALKVKAKNFFRTGDLRYNPIMKNLLEHPLSVFESNYTPKLDRGSNPTLLDGYDETKRYALDNFEAAKQNFNKRILTLTNENGNLLEKNAHKIRGNEKMDINLNPRHILKNYTDRENRLKLLNLKSLNKVK